MIKRIAIKYCGLCNPEIDVGRLVEELKKIMNIDIEIITDPTENIDAFIILNGCKIGCIKKSNYSYMNNIISVNGTNIDFDAVKEVDLAEKIVDKLLAYEGVESIGGKTNFK